jgi:hypothetical protein
MFFRGYIRPIRKLVCLYKKLKCHSFLKIGSNKKQTISSRTTNSFSGKTALILGGTSGINNATATLLLKKDAVVHIVSKEQQSAGGAVQELKALGLITGHFANIFSLPEVIVF